MANIFDGNSITKRNKIYEVPEGTMILKEGEINLDMYKILSGHAEMYTGYGTENEILIGMIGPGTCFGEFGILTGKPAIYTIITYSSVKLLRVTEGLMGQFIQENRDDILKIMKNMATNMMRMQHQINQLSEELMIKKQEEEATDIPTSNAKREKEYFDNLHKQQRDELRKYALYKSEKTDGDLPKMRFL